MRQDVSLIISDLDDFSSFEKTLEQNWERFQLNGIFSDNQRPFIGSSWNRCKNNFVDPWKKKANIVYDGDSLIDKKDENQLLLNCAIPQMEELFQYYSNQKVSVALFDNNGIMIENLSNKTLARKIEKQGFFPGSDWSENVAGTNAVGTAIIEKKPLQVFSSEHYCQGWHPWLSTSAPIHDPFTKQVIGILGLTSEKDLIKGHDIHLMKNQTKKISHALSLSLMKEHGVLFQSLYSTNQDPIIIFDLHGKVIWGNNAARYLLHVTEGILLSNFLGHDDDQILDSSTSLQISGNLIGGKNWDITIHPFRIGNHLLGGMAVFLKHQHHNVPLTNGKKLSTKHAFEDIVTNDENMVSLMKKAKKSAFSDKNLFIYGETGTGKELLVQSIHSFGPRSRQPFVAVNCGAIPKELMASELFGYEGGAFTGAKAKGKKGKFLLANKGTIFLDEIGELPLDIQVYLLRVLEEREIVPVGGNEVIPIDVRVVCATHKDLEEEIRKGNFREDLFYRLKVISLTLPPLKERKGDIPLLVKQFLLLEKNSFELSDEALSLLLDYDWPGNIRQLKNCIEQAIFYAESSVILPKDLPKEISSGHQMENSNQKGETIQLKMDLETLSDTLLKTKGNVTRTAKALNISRMTVYRKIKQYDLNHLIKK